MGKENISDLRLGDSTERYLTVMFSDIRSFTSLSESMTRQENFAFINGYLRLMEPVMFRYRGFVDKYIGDAIMALFPTGADDAVRAAIGMLEQLKKFNVKRVAAGKSLIQIGIGLNSGVMMVGAVGGPHRMEPTVISDAVNLASRIEGLTKIYGVPLLITEHTYYGLSEALARDVRFIDRVKVRGKEQPQSVYEVFRADSPRTRTAKRRTRPIFEEALAHYHSKDIPTARRLLRQCLAACPEDSSALAYMERCRRFSKSRIHEGTGEIGLAVKWSPAMAVGEPLIDRQHRELFTLANRFVHAMSNATAFSQVQEILAFLSRYVKEHFETEEQRMREENYPLLDLQLEQHQRFSRLFARLSKDLKSLHSGGKVFLLFRVQLLVVDWLVHHTMKLDRHFGAYVKALRTRRRSTAVGGTGRSPSRQP
ncbi:MAG: bacteriohemerythrin [Burkholderiales bacterium]|nr:bacteriohemerythrin [Burkholderiales bacterium]